MGRERAGDPPRMSFRDAMDIVPPDLPDGAFFAMAHELAGLEYGDGFLELDDADFEQLTPDLSCPTCRRVFPAQTPSTSTSAIATSARSMFADAGNGSAQLPRSRTIPGPSTRKR